MTNKVKEFWIHFNDYSICSEDGIWGYAQNLAEAKVKLKQIAEDNNGTIVEETASKAQQLIHLLEMSKIGSYDNHLIYIYPESLGNPSFHLKYKDEWEVILQIKDLSILEVKKGDFKKGDQLLNKERKALIDYLNTSIGNMTKWEYLLHTWNSNNEQYEIPTDTPIPSE